MNEAGLGSVPFPVRFADIIFASGIVDPSGQKAKQRRVVILTPDADLAAGYPIVVAAVTGTLPPTLTRDYVLLPYKDLPGRRHSKPGLPKQAAVLWGLQVDPGEITGRSGFVPASQMAVIVSKTSVSARKLGGWI